MRERLLDGCPSLVRESLGPDRPLILGARNSDGKGSTGRRLAAQNAHVLAQTLFDDGVIDVRDLIPSQSELIALLESSADRVGLGSDNWRFVEWRSPDRSVLLVVSQGSGTKVDDQDLQIFMERLRDLIRSLHPVAVWTHEGDRMGRDEVGTLRLVRAIEANRLAGFPCELGFGRRGALSQHDGWDIPLYFEARQARIQADSLKRRTRDAMRLQTGTEMVNGRFDISLPNSLPPGLARVRALDGRGATGRGLAYLDCAEFRPLAASAAEPLHICVDDSGEVADQVANVQWALSEMANGRPAMSIARALAARGFSTMAFGRRHGRGASYRSVFGEPTSRIASSMCRSISLRLEFYESGTLTTTVGGQPFSIRNCAPPGGWLSRETAAGVREWIAKRTQRPRASLARGALTGLDVSLDGDPYRLVSGSRHCTCGGVQDG